MGTVFEAKKGDSAMPATLRAALLLLFLTVFSDLVFAASQFLPAARYSLRNKSIFVAVGDFNGDGILDLATCGENPLGGSAYSILLGNGDGTFQRAHTYSDGGAYGIAVADLNGDGKLDLVMDGPGPVVVALGNGDGTFQKSISYPAAMSSYGLAVGDFNGDGKVDVVITDQYRQGVDLLLGNGDGTLGPPIFSGPLGSFPSDVIVADFNRDHKLDIATSNIGDDTIAVALGNGDGTFQPATKYTLNGMPSSLVSADFNRDGKLDLVTAIGNSIVFLPGNGDGTFGSTTQSAFNASLPYVAGVGDFNHDGYLDVAVADRQAQDLELALGLGDGSFLDGGSYALGGNHPLNGTVADFNHDGWPDVAVPDFATRNLSVLINKGRTTD